MDVKYVKYAVPIICYAVAMTFQAGRFVLVRGDDEYVTSFDTWEESEVAFDSNGITARLPFGYRLEDQATGRIWYEGTKHVWEEATT